MFRSLLYRRWPCHPLSKMSICDQKVVCSIVLQPSWWLRERTTDLIPSSIGLRMAFYSIGKQIISCCVARSVRRDSRSIRKAIFVSWKLMKQGLMYNSSIGSNAYKMVCVLEEYPVFKALEVGTTTQYLRETIALWWREYEGRHKEELVPRTNNWVAILRHSCMMYTQWL